MLHFFSLIKPPLFNFSPQNIMGILNCDASIVNWVNHYMPVIQAFLSKDFVQLDHL